VQHRSNDRASEPGRRVDRISGARRHECCKAQSIRVDTARPNLFNWSDHLTRARQPRGGCAVPEGLKKPKEEKMRDSIRAALRCVAALAAAVSFNVAAQAPITLHGAVQFNDGHAFNRALEKFQELTAKYYGKPINFVLHKNSELGLEKDYFAYMNQGISVDYAIVSPAHMSTFSKAAPFIDAPFLFRDIDHWNKVLDADTLKPIADEVAAKGDVMLIGFAGGGTRNIFANKAVRNLAEMKGLKVRVQGAPIWSKTFAAVGMSPTVIAYDEIYNAIQNGVIQAGENEAAGVEAMKFYEVGPNLNMTQHAITIRPICFSGKTFKRLPPDLQAAIVKAGKEAGIHGRQIESGEDQKKLEAMQAAGRLKMIPFADRAAMKKLADPVMADYAKEIGAAEIYSKINSM
jgi:tripartite ATP-independent transporter DctP family solute receptor